MIGKTSPDILRQWANSKADRGSPRRLARAPEVTQVFSERSRRVSCFPASALSSRGLQLTSACSVIRLLVPCRKLLNLDLPLRRTKNLNSVVGWGKNVPVYISNGITSFQLLYLANLHLHLTNHYQLHLHA